MKYKQKYHFLYFYIQNFFDENLNLKNNIIIHLHNLLFKNKIKNKI